MYQVAAAVRALGTRDWFDYLSVLAPLVLSAVAIWISISTARKQNRIALFNMRYDAIVDIRAILLFESKIDKDAENRIIKVIYDGLFGTTVSSCGEKDAIVQILATTCRLEKSCLINVLVSGKDFDDVHNAITTLQALMIEVVGEEKAVTEKEEFQKACKTLLDGSYNDLCKKAQV